MSSIFDHIKDLLIFYVKTHYDNYLTTNNLSEIPRNKIREIVNKIYSQKKENVKQFVISSLKKLLNDEYPGDAIVTNTLSEIFNDDELCVHKLVLEIDLYQQENSRGPVSIKKI